MLKGLLKNKNETGDNFKTPLYSQEALDEVLKSSFHLRKENPKNIYRKSSNKLKNHPLTKHKRWLVHDILDDSLWTMTALGSKRKTLEYEFGALALCKKHENIVHLREVIFYENNYLTIVEIPANKAIALNVLLKKIHANHGPMAHFVSYKEAKKRKDEDPLKWTEPHVLYVLYEVLKALSHFHDNNIIHQDIRPENIVVDVNGGIKVSDTLYAIILTEEQPLAKTPRGVPHYMSPEAVSGKEFDEKADIWTYGIFTLKVAENRIPFRDEKDQKELIKKIFTSKPSGLHEKIGWSSELLRMNKLCLQHNVTIRPSSSKLMKFKIWDQAMNKEEFGNYMAHFTGAKTK